MKLCHRPHCCMIHGRHIFLKEGTMKLQSSVIKFPQKNNLVILVFASPLHSPWWTYRISWHVKNGHGEHHKPPDPGDLITPTPHHAVVRTLARILGFYIETIFELVRVSNKDAVKGHRYFVPIWRCVVVAVAVAVAVVVVVVVETVFYYWRTGWSTVLGFCGWLFLCQEGLLGVADVTQQKTTRPSALRSSWYYGISPVQKDSFIC